VIAASRLRENPATKLAMALRKGMRVMAWGTRINPYSQLALALPVA
jgi:hypothetical protein